jgi:hypothetical protein
MRATQFTRAGGFKSATRSLRPPGAWGGRRTPSSPLQFLTGGNLDLAAGLFLSPTGHTKYYKATDNLFAEEYRGVLPEERRGEE